MKEMTPDQMKAELKRLNEENEELRHKVKQNEALTTAGRFTIKDLLGMRGIDNPEDVCENCGGLGVASGGSNEQCAHCGGSGSNKNHWVVLQ